MKTQYDADLSIINFSANIRPLCWRSNGDRVDPKHLIRGGSTRAKKIIAKGEE